MKPYADLTRLGRLRRLRKLAQLALREYDLPGAELKFLHYQGNLIFRADLPELPAEPVTGPFLPDRFNLRILTMNDPEAIRAELLWLTAIRQGTGLPVPEPVPNRSGELLTEIMTPGVPQGRVVSLMRWVDGRHRGKNIPAQHVRAFGRLVAQLHKFAASWQPPPGFKRFHWDYDGLFGKHGELGGTPVAELVAAMPDQYRQPFVSVSTQIRQMMDAFGKQPDAYGMIHADLYPDNLLFKAGEPRIIDFEDCGFGYWMYDLGTALSPWAWRDQWPQMRAAFLDGYAEIRQLPEAQLQHLDLFIAAQFAVMVLWATLFIQQDPAMRAVHEAWLHKDGARMLEYFDR